MQMLGLHELPCTAQSHERLVQVSYVCPVVSRTPSPLSVMTTCWCSCDSAGPQTVHKATHLRGRPGILQVTGGYAGTAWFGARCTRSTAVV